MNYKELPDLTTPGQKIIAGGLLVLGLVGLYFLLPPMVVIMKNLWLTALLGAPMVFAAANYQVIWGMFKQLSWKMTSKLISSDPLWHMYRYYDYLLERIQGLQDAITEVNTIKIKSTRRIVEYQEELNKFINQAQREEAKNPDSVVTRVLKSKISMTQKNIDVLLPKLEFIDHQTNQLSEVHTMWSADTEILKHELDTKAQEYEMLKELSGASDKASMFLGGNSMEIKMFKESLKQIEHSVSSYAANIASFDNQILPQMARAGADFEYNVEEGNRVIEQIKQDRLKIN